MLDTAVYDIQSRKMLFRAPGTSKVKGRSTPVNLSEELRIDSVKGFQEAAEKMTANLDLQLTKFKEKIKEKPEEVKIVHREGYSGSGSLGVMEGVLLMLALAAFKYKSTKRV
jgi:rhombotail lipoprotein